jgi:hypothetical protein
MTKGEKELLEIIKLQQEAIKILNERVDNIMLFFKELKQNRG